MTLADLIARGEVSRDEVMLAAVKFLKEWEPEPGASRLPVRTEMKVNTRRPQDWLLVDKVTGKQYEWRNGWRLVG